MVKWSKIWVTTFCENFRPLVPAILNTGDAEGKCFEQVMAVGLRQIRAKKSMVPVMMRLDPKIP